MILLAMALLDAGSADRWRQIDHAAFRLRHCETYVGAEQSILATGPLPTNARADAQAQSCLSERADLAKARDDFYAANHRLVRRTLPFFIATDTACWDALYTIDHESGVPETERQNPQLEVCRTGSEATKVR